MDQPQDDLFILPDGDVYVLPIVLMSLLLRLRQEVGCVTGRPVALEERKINMDIGQISFLQA